MSAEPIETPAPTAVEAVLAHYEEHGSLDCDHIERLARNPWHPLHRFLEWDDTVAAREYRVQQVEKIVRRVKVLIIRPEPSPPVRVRAFVPKSVVDGEEGPPRVFTSVTELTAEQRARLMVQAEREWKALRTKFSMLDEFFELVRRDIAVVFDEDGD